MKNGDQEAFPRTFIPGFPGASGALDGGAPGLTKRELLAAMVLQGLSANPHPDVAAAGSEGRARWAVETANDLLAALDATPAADHSEPTP